MSAYNPPTYYFSNIQFNSDFYISLNSTLSQTQANALYLLKNTADTATALESFTGGILTNSVNPTTSSSTQNIGTTSNNVINIGTLSGRSQFINIGNGASNVAGSAVNINNGSNTTSNVNILNGAGSIGGIYLGSTSGIVTIYPPITFGYTTGFTPTSSQLGYRVTLVSLGSGSTSPTSGLITSLTSFNLGVGTWIINGICQSTSASTYITTSIRLASLGTGSHDTSNWSIVANSGANPTLTNNAILTNATSGTVSYNFLVQANSASATLGSIYVIGLRIA